MRDILNRLEHAMVDSLIAGIAHDTGVTIPGLVSHRMSPDPPQKNTDDQRYEYLIEWTDDIVGGGNSETYRYLDGVATIHTKIRRDGTGIPEYNDGEMPAIGVYCTGKSSEDNEMLTEGGATFALVFDVVGAHGVTWETDHTLKRLIADIDSIMRGIDLGIIDDADTGITTLDGWAGIMPGDSTVSPIFTGEINWISEGACSATVTFDGGI